MKLEFLWQPVMCVRGRVFKVDWRMPVTADRRRLAAIQVTNGCSRPLPARWHSGLAGAGSPEAVGYVLELRGRKADIGGALAPTP